MAVEYEDGVAAHQRGDFTIAMRLWRPLAEQGNADAQCSLGFMYENGRGVPQDHAAAANWYRRAADQGHAGAQFNLGRMYAHGQGVPQDEAAAANWYRRAADQGHAGAHLAYYDKAITLDPNNASFFFGRAIAYVSNGEFIRALADYDEAIRLDPNDAHTFYKRGNAYENTGDYDRAIADYGQTIDLDPKAPIPYYRRGLAYAHQGQHGLAISDFDEAIRLDAADGDFFAARGMAYFSKGQFDRAIADYDEAIRLNSKDTSSLVWRGKAYVMKGQYDRAVSDYDEAIKLNPKDAEAFCSRGVAYYRKGDYDRVIADCNNAVKLNPKDAGSFALRGLAYAKKGQYDSAITDYDEAIRLKPNFTQAIKNRAEIVSNSGKISVTQPLRPTAPPLTLAEYLAAPEHGHDATDQHAKGITKKSQFDSKTNVQPPTETADTKDGALVWPTKKMRTIFWWAFLLVPLFTGILAYNWLPNKSYDPDRDEMLSSHEVCQSDPGPCGDMADVWRDKKTGRIFSRAQFAAHRHQEATRMAVASFAYGLIGCFAFAYFRRHQDKDAFFKYLGVAICVNLAVAIYTFCSIYY